MEQTSEKVSNRRVNYYRKPAYKAFITLFPVMIHPLIPYIHLLLANDLEQRTYMHLVELVTLII